MAAGRPFACRVNSLHPRHVNVTKLQPSGFTTWERLGRYRVTWCAIQDRVRSLRGMCRGEGSGLRTCAPELVHAHDAVSSR